MTSRRCVLLLLSSSLAGGTSGDSPRYVMEPRSVFSRQRLDSRFVPAQIELLEKLNRADRAHLGSLPQLVLPEDWALDELAHSPLPPRYELPGAAAKLLVVDLANQAFGGYEQGRLVRWGPVSSGGAHAPTPPGRYQLNWRAEGRCSTVNPDWYMRWYFNFDNRRGLAFHEYALPGLPASHGCVRLLHRDAMWLYGWGEAPADCEPSGVRREGTPVLITGRYDTHASPPWRLAASR